MLHTVVQIFNGCLVTANGLVNDIGVLWYQLQVKQTLIVLMEQMEKNNYYRRSNAIYLFMDRTPTFTTQNVATGFNVGIKTLP